MTTGSLLPLPIEGVLPALRAALAQHRAALLTAPPGAGKTTRVPLALLGEPWLGSQRVLMLEPRRLAARAAASRMALSLGQTIGEAVGYRIRHDTKVGPTTRVEVVTEGILTRMVQHDPSLQGFGCVIFDEFHERSLHADLGLALSLEAQRLFRPDLRLLVMSATLDCAAVTKLLQDAPVVASEGRSYPVEVLYLERPVTGPPEQEVAACVGRVLRDDSGSLLVFLPGMAEIRRVQRRLEEAQLGPAVTIAPLHGDLSQAEQDRAIAPSPPGQRKIVLATSIAETSLTIDGVRVVIDVGLLRVPRYDPRSGLARLETIRVTKDSSEQRCGRAGRTEAGRCYRLWTQAEHQALLPRRPPEILDADLTSLVLELAVWGVANPAELSWLDPPPAGAVAQARELLRQLGALDARDAATAHGRRMAELGLHPRLAHMIIAAQAMQAGDVACDVAALLTERDLARFPAGRHQADLRLRLDLLHGRHNQAETSTVDRAALHRARQLSEHWRRQLRLPAERPRRTTSEEPSVGVLLAYAYPDRIAQRVPGPTSASARYRLANGRGAAFAGPDVLASHAYLVIAELDGSDEWGRITRAAPLEWDELERHCAARIEDVDFVEWDARREAVLARRQRRLGQLVLLDQGLPNPDESLIRGALLTALRREGLTRLSWTSEQEQWRARVALLRRAGGTHSDWPDVSDEALLARIEEWLGPELVRLSRLDQVARVDLTPPLRRLLTGKQQQALERLAPTHLAVPTGSRIRLDYASGERPVLAVRLQELFGCRETPRVADGAVPVVIHLLSPAGRPVQVTQDLARFWATSYRDVRKELRGRYPKHHWPEDPLTAAPTRRAKRPGEREQS